METSFETETKQPKTRKKDENFIVFNIHYFVFQSHLCNVLSSMEFCDWFRKYHRDGWASFNFFYFLFFVLFLMFGDHFMTEIQKPIVYSKWMSWISIILVIFGCLFRFFFSGGQKLHFTISISKIFFFPFCKLFHFINITSTLSIWVSI